MIELGKKYQTKSGFPVRLYADDGNDRWPIHGAFNPNSGWIVSAWSRDGGECHSDGAHDLIEIQPRAIDRIEAWLEGYVRNAGQQLSGETITAYRNVLELVRQLKAKEDAQS